MIRLVLFAVLFITASSSSQASAKQQPDRDAVKEAIATLKKREMPTRWVLRLDLEFSFSDEVNGRILWPNLPAHVMVTDDENGQYILMEKERRKHGVLLKLVAGWAAQPPLSFRIRVRSGSSELGNASVSPDWITIVENQKAGLPKLIFARTVTKIEKHPRPNLLLKKFRLLQRDRQGPLLEFVLVNPEEKLQSLDNVTLYARYVNHDGGAIACAFGSIPQPISFLWRRDTNGKILTLEHVTTEIGREVVAAEGQYRSLACDGYPTGSYSVSAKIPLAIDLTPGELRRVRLVIAESTRGVSMFSSGSKMGIGNCQKFTILFDSASNVYPKSASVMRKR